MSSVFDTPFTPAEQEFLKSKLFRYNIIGTCHVWYGMTREHGYGVIRPTFRGKKQVFTVHRLQYFLSNNCHFTDKSYHVSHLCHNKLCLNIEHLSLEPAEVNIERNQCKRLQTCFGHNGFKNCVLR